mmetsp:Transcript_81095/g.262674  ORF Transcript_81095/g.262674 Transcript_81095/m.262674 type:complete len:247 (+) Transcript_81095:828-1568(+)
MASMNSSGSISPLSSSSTIMNNCLKSRLSMSRTRSQCRNSATRRAPSSSSVKFSVPPPSASILAKILARTSFSSASCWSMSAARLPTSLSRFSAKVSTITATMRFKIPNTSVSKAPPKMTIVHGSASITGTAMYPQLSPATTVWKKVTLAMKTDENERRHLSHPSQAPSSATFWTKGLITSTAITAQMVIVKRSNNKDQKSVFIQLPIICRRRLSSFSTAKRRMTLSSLSSLISRARRTTPRPVEF